MSREAATLIFLFFELIISLSLAIFMISILYSSIKGAPYVPTSQKDVEDTLKQANLRKGQVFLELGSGDGRVVRTAVKNYQVKGIGVDINPVLVFWSRILARRQHLTDINFIKKNIFDIDLSQADIIYLFLMPVLIERLTEKLNREIKKNSLVISHGFKIIGWEKNLIKKIDRTGFPSYFYCKK
jgi:hypothetical protein